MQEQGHWDICWTNKLLEKKDIQCHSVTFTSQLHLSQILIVLPQYFVFTVSNDPTSLFTEYNVHNSVFISVLSTEYRTYVFIILEWDLYSPCTEFFFHRSGQVIAEISHDIPTSQNIIQTEQETWVRFETQVSSTSSLEGQSEKVYPVITEQKLKLE